MEAKIFNFPSRPTKNEAETALEAELLATLINLGNLAVRYNLETGKVFSLTTSVELRQEEWVMSMRTSPLGELSFNMEGLNDSPGA